MDDGTRNDRLDRQIGRRLLEEELGAVARERPAAQFEITHGRYCKHASMEVCEQQRTVVCTACRAQLDPFDVLFQFAARERQLRHVDDEIRRAGEALEKLKEEERRAKARVRRARELADALEARVRAGAQEGLDL